MQKEIALEVTNIHKRYGGIQALKAVNLAIHEGEVCALVGENGAGKSTLIKILTGVEQMDEGEILLYNISTRISSPVSARDKGIVAIYQELSLIENLTVADNIFLGHEPETGFGGWNNDKTLLEKAHQYLKQFDISIDPRQKVNNLGLGEKRIIEIVKALSSNARILLLDEPTTGMSMAEIDSLFKIMKDLKQHKVTMIYISHYLDEIFQVSDRIFVLRDGQNSGVFETAQADTSQIVHAMIGKDIDEHLSPQTVESAGKVLLKAIEFQGEAMKKPISFELHEGDILGITGIIGAGKSELGLALFGASKMLSGNLYINERAVSNYTTRQAKASGVGFIPEDRKNQGLFLSHSIADNLSIANIDLWTWGKTFLLQSRLAKSAAEIMDRLHIVPPQIKMKARQLSGGNQQKVVIGKWLMGSPSILIMDEPTRGVDVGAKGEIYNLIQSLAANKKGIIVLTSEFEEVQRICNRIIVLRKGAVAGELIPQEATNDRLLSLALGV